MWRKVGQDASPATTGLRPSTGGQMRVCPELLGFADLGSSRLSCNANSPPHTGISIAKITWKDGEATLSNTGQKGRAQRRGRP